MAVSPNPSQKSSSAHRVIVFSTPTCPWCNRAKGYLRGRSIPFRDVNVSRDPAAPATSCGDRPDGRAGHRDQRPPDRGLRPGPHRRGTRSAPELTERM